MTDTVSPPSAAGSDDGDRHAEEVGGPGDADRSAPASHVADAAGGDSPYASLSPEGRFDVVVQLSGAISAMQAELGRAVAAVDEAADHVGDGATDVAAWLVMATGVNRRHARETVRVAKALEGLPALRGVFAAGAVAFDQVRAVTRFATEETDIELARQLPGWSAAQVEAMARRLAPKRDEEAATARNRRELHWRADHKAGGFRYRGFLPADQAAAVNAALTDLAERAGPDAESGVWEPFTTRCADALHHLAIGDRHPGEDSLAVLHVDAATVAWAAHEAAGRAAARTQRPEPDPWAAAARHPDDTAMAADRSGRQAPITGTEPADGHPAAAPPPPAAPDGSDHARDTDSSSRPCPGLPPAGPPEARASSPPTDPIGSDPHPPPTDRSDASGPGAPPGPAPPFDWVLPPDLDGAPSDPTAGAGDLPDPVGPRMPPGPDAAPPGVPAGDAVPPNGVLDGMAVGRDTVLRYLCDCDIEFSVEGPDGTTVGIGRRSRTFPDWMRRHIEARDATCRFPGCDRAIRHIHHNRHWTRDRGPTDSPNCTGLCWAHHHLVHEGQWEIAGNADGTLTFTSPHGRQVSSRRQPLRPTTRAAAARITGTTLTITPPDIHPPPDRTTPPGHRPS